MTSTFHEDPVSPHRTKVRHHSAISARHLGCYTQATNRSMPTHPFTTSLFSSFYFAPRNANHCYWYRASELPNPKIPWNHRPTFDQLWIDFSYCCQTPVFSSDWIATSQLRTVGISCLRLVWYRAPVWPFHVLELAVSTLRPPFISPDWNALRHTCAWLLIPKWMIWLGLVIGLFFCLSVAGKSTWGLAWMYGNGYFVPDCRNHAVYLTRKGSRRGLKRRIEWIHE